jgi:hypothetical protein
LSGTKSIVIASRDGFLVKAAGRHQAPVTKLVWYFISGARLLAKRQPQPAEWLRLVSHPAALRPIRSRPDGG